MKKKLLLLFKMLSKFVFYGIFSQILFWGVLIAKEGNAQDIKRISEVNLNFKLGNASIQEVFDLIEAETDYHFFYDENTINTHQQISIKKRHSTVEDVLFEISKQANLKFRQINEVINVNLHKPETGTKKSDLVVIEQGITVTGRVMASDNNEALPGVNVVIKGTTQGTVTDIDGNYKIVVPDESTVLVFSSVGYTTENITIGTQSVIDVNMNPDIMALKEIVVIGYGTAKREELTGSISSVNLENSPVALAPNLNPLESLKGKVSGLNIGATNTAGGEPSMLVRGTNSLGGNNDPLIILDGVIYMGSLSDINPNDIASVDVMKDALSASIYGSRSANGVIAITTKKGRSEKPVITFNTSTGVQTWQNKPVMMKGEEWIKVVNDRNQYPEGTTSWMKSGELANLDAGKETVWLDEVTQTGVLQDYQVSISGAPKNVNYYLSTAYSKNKGIVVGDNFNRISILGKVNTNVTDWLNVGADASYTKRDYSGFAASISTAEVMSPYGVEYRDDQGNLEKYPYTQSGVNPLWGVHDGTRDNMDIRHNYRLNTFASVDIPGIKGLNFRMNYQINYDENKSGDFYHEGYYIAEGEGLDRYSPSVVQGYLAKANGDLNNNNTFSYVWDNILSYSNTFGKHHIDGTLVATRDYSKYNIVYVTGSDFAANGSTSLGMWGLHKATVQRVDLYVNDNNINGGQIGGVVRTNIGYLGRINYAFNNKYYLTGSFRRDGASVFGANNKWGNFAAVGLAWKLSDETFMNNLDRLNDLKLKLSWGQNGNQGAGPYSTLSQVANGPSGGYRYEFSDTPGTIYYGLVQSTLGNFDLGWESTSSWNAGFESSWLDNRLSVDFDAYFSKTTNEIVNRSIPVMTGFKTILTSIGQVNNNGVELTIRSVNIQNSNLHWNTELNYWRNRNKIVHLDGSDSNGDGIEDDNVANNWFIGEPIGAIYGYEQDGIVQENDAEYIALTSAAPGSPKYKNLDGVDGITADDRTILGYAEPNFSIGLSNSVGFKNFDLYVMFSGIFGGNDYYMKANQFAYMTSGTGLFNANLTSKPYWTPENPSNVYTSATFAGDGRFLGLQSRGFLRLQDISLSYTFNQQWVKNANISMLKVFFSAKNVATITNWFGGDPETGTPVRDNTFPVPSTYSLGANISF